MTDRHIRLLSAAARHSQRRLDAHDAAAESAGAESAERRQDLSQHATSATARVDASRARRRDGPGSDTGTSSPDAVSNHSTRRLEELEDEARYARERFQLYRAKSYGPRLTSPARLRELERELKRTQNRVGAAKAEQRRGS